MTVSTPLLDEVQRAHEKAAKAVGLAVEQVVDEVLAAAQEAERCGGSKAERGEVDELPGVGGRPAERTGGNTGTLRSDRSQWCYAIEPGSSDG